MNGVMKLGYLPKISNLRSDFQTMKLKYNVTKS